MTSGRKSSSLAITASKNRTPLIVIPLSPEQNAAREVVRVRPCTLPSRPANELRGGRRHLGVQGRGLVSQFLRLGGEGSGIFGAQRSAGGDDRQRVRELLLQRRLPVEKGFNDGQTA